ncbi:MAG: sensor histidine kinase [Cellulosilyticaceae bacterium]
MTVRRYLYGILMLVICGLLDGYLIMSSVPDDIIKIVIIAEIIIGILICLLIINTKKQMQKLLEQLSKLIGSITDKQQEEVFSPLKDELPSKLQLQVMRLSEILQSDMASVTEEKESIERLLGDIAHQLKTPLTNVGIYTELLAEVRLDETTYQTFYEGLRLEVDKLEFLIESFIKTSRLEGGVIKLKCDAYNVQDTCLSAIKHTYAKAKEKDIVIAFESKASIIVKHDIKWTSEAIENMIDNAIKYSEPNTTIKVSIIPYEVFVRIDIEDQGIGIPPHEVTRIFKRFYRGEKVTNEEGVGIGLYLARKIITDQGGYIKVKSVEGKGSIFSVFLLSNR